MNSEGGRTAITRPPATLYAVITAVELAYLLRMNLPQLWPQPACGLRGLNDVCVLVQPPFRWPWIAVATLLLLSAVAVLLRKKFGVAITSRARTRGSTIFLAGRRPAS